ncbi:Protein SPA1-RELATED 4 [Platanthera guangdongensis]|uniref:Protein SPA1-RELATED 4 n=1 Tax=Platanthera guangdongensis TaxID=2320717 RepID=A0ABR2M0V2_9ASPA
MEEQVEEEGDQRRRRTGDGHFDAKLKISCHADRKSGKVSLREWMDSRKGTVNFTECLHIFRQVARVVSLAHNQKVVVNNIRPSCFVMSNFNWVSFIESSSRSSSGSREEIDGGISAALVDRRASVERRRELHSASDDADEKRDFPLKKILIMEFNWYASPEEVDGGPSTFASDVYKLGVLLFELFCMFDTLEEKNGIMSNLRDRVLPPQMLLKWPSEASFCLWLLHPLQSSRPTMSELLQSEFLNEEIDSLAEREAAIKLNEEIEELDLFLDFLLQLQASKLEAADKLHDTISFLCADIERVEIHKSTLRKNKWSSSKLEKSNHAPVHDFECPPPYSDSNKYSSSSSSRKRIKCGHKDFVEEKYDENHLDRPRLDTNREKILSKSSRISKNFKKLEEAYFSSRYRAMRPSEQLVGSTKDGSVDVLVSKKCHGNGRMNEWANPFLENLCKYLSFSKFEVRAAIKQGDILNSCNLICSLAFDRDKEFFAAAGVNRKIKVFECDTILKEDRDVHYPVAEMVSKSKISNVCWNGYIKSQIASSDFEGAVQVWDVARSEVLVEMREHKKRAWSVDYSPFDPMKLASGSDDGTVKLWNINQGGSTGTIKTMANVCSVQFPPDSASGLAIGSADHNVYYYDLRNVRLPLLTFVGHERTVSYVKFLDSSNIVSSSTDNSLKIWDLSLSTSGLIENPIQTFTGHTNAKNFVGLSIFDDYIATGSETNEVFVYHKAFPMPVLSYKFGTIDPISADVANHFISCMCWRGETHTLVAASSSGNIEVLEMV